MYACECWYVSHSTNWMSVSVCFVVIGKLKTFKCGCSSSTGSALILIYDQIREQLLIFTYSFLCFLPRASTRNLRWLKHVFDKTGKGLYISGEAFGKFFKITLIGPSRGGQCRYTPKTRCYWLAQRQYTWFMTCSLLLWMKFQHLCCSDLVSWTLRIILCYLRSSNVQAMLHSWWLKSSFFTWDIDMDLFSWARLISLSEKQQGVISIWDHRPGHKHGLSLWLTQT